jgi:hypothetical protein
MGLLAPRHQNVQQNRNYWHSLTTSVIRVVQNLESTCNQFQALQSFGGREFDASLGSGISKNRCTASVDTICEHVGAYVFTMLLQVIQKNTHDMVCFRFQNFPSFR